MSARIAEAHSIDNRYMNATLPCGVAFRGGVAAVDDERKLIPLLRTKGISVRITDAYIERLPEWLEACGPFNPPVAMLDLPEGYTLRHRKGGPWELLFGGKTLEQRYPIPDDERLPTESSWIPPVEEGAIS